MWTIFLGVLSSRPVKAVSTQEGGEGRAGAEQEEFGGAGGGRAATAAREGTGESLRAGLKQVAGSSSLGRLKFFPATREGGRLLDAEADMEKGDQKHGKMLAW